MNKEKPYIYKRFIAYFVDMIIISFVSTLLTTYVIKDRDYIENSNKLMELISKGQSTEKLEEYNKEYQDINYEMQKVADITIIMSVISILYYVIFTYYRDGITLGKQIMKLKIVSNDKKKLNINNYLIRALFINRISLDIINSALVIFLSKKAYLNWSTRITEVYWYFLIASLIMMFFRKDGRGIQDIIANTKVVNIKKEGIVEEVKVQEAEYEDLPNTIQIDDVPKEEEEKEEKEDNKKSKKKSKKVIETKEGVCENERV